MNNTITKIKVNINKRVVYWMDTNHTPLAMREANSYLRKHNPARGQRNTKEHTVKPVIMSRCRTEQISFLCSMHP